MKSQGTMTFIAFAVVAVLVMIYDPRDFFIAMVYLTITYIVCLIILARSNNGQGGV